MLNLTGYPTTVVRHTTQLEIVCCPDDILSSVYGCKVLNCYMYEHFHFQAFEHDIVAQSLLSLHESFSILS